ncbi:MAG TPA: hypothetical protein VEJ63_04135 [Planctomycetota bacterium]|nr:hypothetical protein [Planctomycetota bacterium]
MKTFALLFSLVLAGGVLAEGQEKPPLKPLSAMDQPERKPPRWQDAEWLGQIDQLRSHPRAGDIHNGPLTANVADVFEMDEETRKKVQDVMKEYDQAVLDQARRWNKEVETLRADFERKLVEAMPEPKRETTRKVLDFSHRNWSSSFQREEQFKKEYKEKSTAVEKELAGLGEDQQDKRKEMRQKMSAWVAERRKTLSDPDREAIKQLREMLSPEEVARLDKFDRSRPIVAQPPGAQPGNQGVGPRERPMRRERERNNKEQGKAPAPPTPQPAPAQPAPVEQPAPAPAPAPTEQK